MRITWTFLLYTVFVIVTGCLLAPWLWAGVQWSVATGLTPDLEDTPYFRVLRRALMVAALIGFWPFIRALRLNRPADWGFGLEWRAGILPLEIGVIAGIVSLTLLVLALRWLGILAPEPHTWDVVAGRAADALVSAVVVALLEEIFFRGMVHSAWRRAGGPAAAIGVTAFIYAAVHFLQGEHSMGAVQWTSGFAALGGLATGWEPLDFLGAFLSLLGVGLFLGWLRERTGHIWYCIGLHAGWVWAIAVSRRVTEPADGPWGWVVSDYDEITGFPAAAWLVVMFVLTWWLARRYPNLIRKAPHDDVPAGC